MLVTAVSDLVNTKSWQWKLSQTPMDRHSVIFVIAMPRRECCCRRHRRWDDMWRARDSIANKQPSFCSRWWNHDRGKNSRPLFHHSRTHCFALSLWLTDWGSGFWKFLPRNQNFCGAATPFSFTLLHRWEAFSCSCKRIQVRNINRAFALPFPRVCLNDTGLQQVRLGGSRN